jgi:hypothetical protein
MSDVMIDDVPLTDELEDRLLRAVHDQDGDLEELAHIVAASDGAQAYLVELVETLTTLSAASPPAMRAAALLEHGLAIVAEHGADAHAESSAAAASHASSEGRDR